jgi:hypothetical protein
MGARMSQAAPVGDASIPAASETGAFIAAFSWQPLSGGVMIGAEVGRMTSRVGERRVPKYGRLMPFPGNARVSRNHHGGRLIPFRFVAQLPLKDGHGGTMAAVSRKRPNKRSDVGPRGATAGWAAELAVIDSTPRAPSPQPVRHGLP